MRRIFYLTCLLILYGSFYPFRLIHRESIFGVIPVLAASAHFVLDKGFVRDVVLNLLIYIPVGFFFVLDEHRHDPVWKRILKATLAGCALSSFVEFTQYNFEQRSPSVVDIFDNTVSTFAGAALGVVFGSRARHTLDTLSGTRAGHPSSALFLALVWLSAFFSPRDWGRTAVFDKIRGLLHAPVPTTGALFVGFAEWIALGALAAAIGGRKWAPALLAACLLLQPLRMMVPGQKPEVWELAGAALALLIWSIPALSRRLSIGAVGWLLVAAILADQLRPWQWNPTAAPFGWTPFLALLRADWVVSLVVLLRKTALYGTAVWAVTRSISRIGARGFLGVAVGSSFVAVVLAGTEVLQRYLPGRTPESTDPILALVAGLIVFCFDRKYGPDPGIAGDDPAAAAPPAPAGLQHSPSAAERSPAAAAPKAKVWTGGRRSRL